MLDENRFAKNVLIMLIYSMQMGRLFFLLVMMMSGVMALAQEAEIKPSSATDSKVKIHEGKRVRATRPQKEQRARFTDKKKKGAVNVSEPKPKVHTTSKRMQKRNAKFRSAGR